LGLEVVVITSKPREKPVKNPFKTSVNTTFLRSTLNVGANPFAPNLLNALKRENADVLHTQAPTLYGDLTTFSGRILGTPVVATYHGSITKSSIPGPMLKLYNIMHPALSLKQCNHIIVTTSRYNTVLENMGLSKTSISVIPVGIEKEFAEAEVPSDADSEFEKLVYGLKRKAGFKLLFVGALDRHHFYKGLENLLLAFSTIVRVYHDSILIVVGDGERKTFYKRLATDLGISSSTLFVGWVPKKLLIALYSRSDLFVLPSCSFSEGFGIVLLEAMSRGCPVLTTYYAGGSEAVRKGKAGIVINSADPRLLSEAITVFMKNKDFAQKCGRNGLMTVRREYTWEILSEKILKIYKQYA
jgi:glycosyltransferase involved in cell wall biosynthesis